MRLRKCAWKAGLRYRLNYKLPGKPDLVFVSAKVAVFVDGCFWHGCQKHSAIPQTNRAFWKKKIVRNMERDREVTEELIGLGWIVLRFWEHQVKDNPDECISKIKESL